MFFQDTVLEEGNLFCVGSGNSSEDKSKAQHIQQCSHCCLATHRDPAGSRQPPGNTRIGFAMDESCGEGVPGPSLLFHVVCGSTARTCKEQERFLMIKNLLIWTI